MNLSRGVPCAAPGHVHIEDFRMGIKYTDHDHEEIKALSLKWWEKKPVQAEDIFEYAVLQYRLKDFEAAVSNLKLAVEMEYTASYYLYADCLYHFLSVPDKKTAHIYYRKFLEETTEEKEPQIIYQRAMCYAYGLGNIQDDAKADALFSQIKDKCGEAKYELGCAYRDATLGLPQDNEKAERYLREAYDNYAEQAIFALYQLYECNWETFPYQRELTEAYSYQIGKYARVIHVNPSVQAYQNLAELYLHGFPGDVGEDDARFKRKANKYLKKIQQMKSQQKV